jgi:hypothetical protein
MAIHYLNTDLDLMGAGDLTRLAAALESRGVCALHLECGADSLWRATFETERQHTEPDANIAKMLGVVEALVGAVADDWWALRCVSSTSATTAGANRTRSIRDCRCRH